MRTKGTGTNYILFNYDKFFKDLSVFVYDRYKDTRLSLSKLMREIGISETTVYNAKKNAENGTGNYNITEYEEGITYGVMQKVYMEAICNKAGLNIDDYLVVKKKSVDKQEKEELLHLENNKDMFEDMQGLIKTYNENEEKLIQLIASLVKVEYQNRDILASISSDIKAQDEKLDKIASGIQQINDKYNKPSAYICK